MEKYVEKKMEEMEMGLIKMKKKIEINEIQMNVNKIVEEVIKRCDEERSKNKVEDFGDKVEE